MPYTCKKNKNDLQNKICKSIYLFFHTIHENLIKLHREKKLLTLGKKKNGFFVLLSFIRNFANLLEF